MRVYLAGPMRGLPEFNFPAFHRAAAILRGQGHEVFSPAEKDIERHGVDISKGNADGDEEYASKQHGFSLREALGIDLAWICAHAEAVALLPGWERSTGANAERAAAKALGLKLLYLDSPLDEVYVHGVDTATNMVRAELIRARSRFPAFRSTHEGWGVIHEEWIELQQAIMANDLTHAIKEAVQVGAMATSFVVDLGGK